MTARRVFVAGIDGPVWARLGSSDFYVIEELLARQEYHCLFDGRLGEVRRVIDLGANCGYSITLWLSQYPQAQIIAVEPDPDNAAMVRRHLADRDPGGRVKLIQACAAGASRTVYLDRAGEAWAFSFSDQKSPTSIEVPALTVPQILAQAGWDDSPIDLLKCDIEGAERELFADAGAWLPRVRHLLVEVHAPYTGEQLMEAVRPICPNVTMEYISPPAPQRVVYLKP